MIIIIMIIIIKNYISSSGGLCGGLPSKCLLHPNGLKYSGYHCINLYVIGYVMGSIDQPFCAPSFLHAHHSSTTSLVLPIVISTNQRIAYIPSTKHNRLNIKYNCDGCYVTGKRHGPVIQSFAFTKEFEIEPSYVNANAKTTATLDNQINREKKK